ncbi:MAG: Fur family transcriptional regulator [Cyanobacteria bacterium P01_C01_bin.120]
MVSNHSLEVHFPEKQDVLKSLLNQEGLRLTNQRQEIVALFTTSFADEKHLSAEEIHHQLLRQGQKISFSTIYRTLHVMVDLGILREVELAEGKKYYELNAPFASQHHHLVCVQCGEVHEFEDDRVIKVSQQETHERGFSLLNCQFTVYGVCPQCHNMFNSGG